VATNPQTKPIDLDCDLTENWQMFGEGQSKYPTFDSAKRRTGNSEAAAKK